MSNYQPRISTLPKAKALPFVTIAKKVSLQLGSLTKAADALGISRTTITKLVYEDYLTDKSARIILDNYRKLKGTS